MAYTNIDDPSAYFQAKTYTGTSGIHDVTLDGNSDMQPDWVWFKNRDVGYSHQLYDSSRGVNKPLFSDLTNAEGSITNGLTRFDPDGFRVSSAAAINEDSIVCWNWKANGGTTASNTDGDITTTVQANTDAGFSIVTYTGNGTNNTKIGHGLGVTLDMMIVKNRDTAGNWQIFHKDLNAASPEDYRLELNTTDASEFASNIWGTTTRTSTTIAVKAFTETNASGDNYVAYCFASKQGYSKFSKYVGNGNDNGPFMYTGFKPAFVLTKGTHASQWRLYDSARSPNNVNLNRLFPYSSGAEATDTDAGIDMLSNGFKIRGSGGDYNASGQAYIYMAFADNPFVTSTGIPTTAR